MRNFKLTIEYDGTDFHGWQVQPGCRTVQGELYRAFAEFDAGDARITGAGRTDAGVHAAGQVASVKIDIGLGPGVLLRALNAKLPRDVNKLNKTAKTGGRHIVKVLEDLLAIVRSFAKNARPEESEAETATATTKPRTFQPEIIISESFSA